MRLKKYLILGFIVILFLVTTETILSIRNISNSSDYFNFINGSVSFKISTLNGKWNRNNDELILFLKSAKVSNYIFERGENLKSFTIRIKNENGEFYKISFFYNEKDSYINLLIYDKKNNPINISYEKDSIFNKLVQ